MGLIADERGKTMTNIERANKWYEIITRLADISRSTTSLKKCLLASHYIIFATEMWMMYIGKHFRANS